MQCLSIISSCKRTWSVARDEATVRAPPAKRVKRRSKRSGRGTKDIGSDHQTELLTRNDIPTIVQAVWDVLLQRNLSNAVAPLQECLSVRVWNPPTRIRHQLMQTNTRETVSYYKYYI